MSIIATSGGSFAKQLTPAGTYLARCYSMVHIGTLEDDFGGEKRLVNKVRFTFELPTETRIFAPEKGEQPIVIDKEFTLSMHEKSTLRAFLTSWRGKGFTEDEARRFDVTKLLGVPCMLSIIHEPSKKDPSKIYERISSVSSVMKGVTCPDQINPTFMISLAEFDEAKFDSLPDWLRDKISQSKEYRFIKESEKSHQKEVEKKLETFNDNSDDLPF